MVRAKKATSLDVDSPKPKRSAKPRKFNNRNRRRFGKPFPKDTEVKYNALTVSGSVSPSYNSAQSLLEFYPGMYLTVGGSSGDYNLAISQGTAQGQRVGAKVEPLKLRISGTLQLDDNFRGNVNYPPNFWQVRMIVYQVKGGNASKEPSNGDYHQMAMAGSNGNVRSQDIDKLLSEWQASNDHQFTSDQWRFNNGMAQVPLRRGIGSLCRILHEESFWINTQKNPIKQFRIVTEKPSRLIYPETVMISDGVTTSNVCSESIYVVFLWQPGTFSSSSIPTLHFNCRLDLFYTDK